MRSAKVLSKIDGAPQDQLQKSNLILRDIYDRDLFLFVKKALHYKDVSWRTHGEMIHALETPTDRKLVTFPRGGFKSSIGVVGYSTWRLNKNPNLRILIDSELYTNSTTYLREIRSHMEGQTLTSIFGEYKTQTWNESEIIIKQRDKKLKEASITCGGVGTTKVGQHYDIIIGDDYNSPSNSSTPEKCQKVIDHVRYNLSILEPGGEYVFIGTRYAERDIIGWICADILGNMDLAEGKLGTQKFGSK